MTSHSLTATRSGARSATRSGARGIDLMVMRISLAMLLWARRRAERATVTREEHERRLVLHAEIARREHSAALRAARVR